MTLHDDVFEIEARVRMRVRCGGAKDAAIASTRLQSYVTKLGNYTRRRLGLEFEVLDWGEPVYIGRQERGER